MKQYKFFLSLILATISIISCKKEDDLGDVSNIPGLGGDTWVHSDIDKYIYDNFTVPYNMDISYKWDQLALAQVDKNVVPIKEEIMVPLWEAIKRVWIDNYLIELGKDNFKKYCTKFFILAGSAAYNLDGSALLGTAGGGRQIVLFQLNYFKNKTMPGYTLGDTIIQRETFHTIEHEFAHIFDQTKQRPFEFDEICEGFYSGDWINSTDKQAYSEGFISPYASSQAGEDFAEMIAFMLVEGKDGMNKIINNITGTSSRGTPASVAQNRLRQKIQVLEDYYQKFWGINLESLQARTRASIEKEFY